MLFDLNRVFSLGPRLLRRRAEEMPGKKRNVKTKSEYKKIFLLSSFFGASSSFEDRYALYVFFGDCPFSRDLFSFNFSLDSLEVFIVISRHK